MNAFTFLRPAFIALVATTLPTVLCRASEPDARLIQAVRDALKSDPHAKHTLIELLDRKIEREAPDVTTLAELGQLLASAEQWNRAREICEQLAKFEPRPEAAIRRILAEIARGTGEMTEEIDHLRALCALAPEDAEAAVRLAHCLLSEGAFEDALALARRAQSLRPSDAGVLVLQARSLQGLSRWVEAAGAINAASRLDPESVEVKALLPAFERLGAYGAETVQKMAKRKASGRIGPDECSRAGILLIDAGFHAEAIPFFIAASKIAPGAMLPRLLLGQSLASARRFTEIAPLQYIANPLTPLRPADIESFRASDAKLLADPGDAAARYDRAWHLNEIGQFLLSLEECSKIIEDDPKHSGALKEAAYALFNLGRLKEARSRLIEAIELDPSRADAFTLLGRVNTELADLDAAAEAFKKSLALQSNDEVRQLLERTEKIIASR